MATQSFSEFLKKQNTTTKNVGSDKFQQFLQNRNTQQKTTSASKTQTTPVKKNQPQETKWQWFTKQLMKPVGATSEVLETAGKTAGALLLPAISKKVTAKQGLEMAGKELKQGVTDIKDITTGKKVTSYYEKISSGVKEREQAGQKVSTLEKAMGNVFGIGADLILDPSNKLDITKAVSAFGKLTKLDKAANVGSKIVKETAGKIPVTATKNVDDVAKELRGMFYNKTGNKEFDDIVTKFRNLRAYREGEYFDQAVELQKRINTFARQSGQKAGTVQKVIRDALEDNSIIPNLPPQLRDEVMTLKTTYKDALNASKEVGLKVKEIAEYAPRIRTKDSFLNKVQSIAGGAKEFGKGSVEKSRKAFEGMTQSAIENLGDGKYANFFESNPAIQLAVKGQTYAKAITAKEFANAVSKFAVDDGVEVSNSLFKGQKFAPEVAKVIDNYYTSIKPEELNVVLKGFDNVQNLWKAQILVSPAYHMRNVAGNLWNNYLAGVYNPGAYAKAMTLQLSQIKNKLPKMIADKIPDASVFAKDIENIKKLGILGKGQYGGDIPKQISSIGNKKVLQRINPFSRSNDALEFNKVVGSFLEDNAKIAHYLSKTADGLNPTQAAESVKKFLFDYEDLTKFERTIMKRVMPFYTWTRKNVPLQLEQIVKQPGKYAQVAKTQNIVESNTEKPNEQFMSQYLRDNIPVRIRKNKDGNTEYFLMGNWLPAASAIDFLSQPTDNIIGMLSPVPKTIYEQMADQSLYFKTTTGERQDIVGEGEFLGMSMDKQAINMLRNIRVLGDLDKLFNKKNKTEEENSWLVKSLNVLFGRAGTYDVNKSRYFYDKDTQNKIKDYETKIRQASTIGDKNRVNKLQQDLKDFVKSRR